MIFPRARHFLILIATRNIAIALGEPEGSANREALPERNKAN